MILSKSVFFPIALLWYRYFFTSLVGAQNSLHVCPRACRDTLAYQCKDGPKRYHIMFPEVNTEELYNRKETKHCDCDEDTMVPGMPGLTGRECDVEFIMCKDEETVCFNGAPCIPVKDEYVCGCPYTTDPDITYVGKHCEYKVTDLCPLSDKLFLKRSKYDVSPSGAWFCTNNGSCQNGVLNPEEKCKCNDGHFGLHCEHKEERNPCAIECLNGGVCTTGIKDLTQYDDELANLLGAGDDLEMYLNGENTEYCICPEGFTGNTCEHGIETCGDSVCMNGATCVTGLNGPYCDCSTVTITEPNGQRIPHAGSSCETVFSTMCEAMDGYPPEEAFCTNGGACPAEPHLHCLCPMDAYGPRCQFALTLTDTDTNDLDNKGGIKETVKEVDPKQVCNLACANGGTCFLGDAAENSSYLAFDLSSPETKSGRHCRCPPGFGGYLCEIPIEVCGEFSHHCRNGGKCVKDGSNYKCDCVSDSTDGAVNSYAGASCESEATSFCLGPGSNKEFFCTNEGICKETIKLGTTTHPGCVCDAGYKGKYCESVVTKTRTNGIAGKAFLGFTITLFGLFAIFLMVYFVRTVPKDPDGRHNPIGVPQEVNVHARDLDNEHDNTVYMGAGYENEDEQGDDVMDDVNIYN
eukprot:CAMPEP_0198258334 /NCGR_PEP_ID=MMETSP1447-20131203/7793_1 /TAXON_ID=420782 /ORGANISM="Chaetoceros dichaeta, Strain CCMP1751" /LENGTH=633 /DNA_ID=CAMNT_0043945441 /DNA_START=156 /DNA_END=2057 /DNA_ORIENTATION=-